MVAKDDKQVFPSEHPTIDDKPVKKKKPAAKKHWLRSIFLSIVMLLLLITVLMGWLVSTESGLRFGVYKLPSWFGVNISSKTLQGTVLEGFQGDEWQIKTESADLNISSLALKWQPKALLHQKLHINLIAVGDVLIVSKATPPRPEEVSGKLPDSISLPVEVLVDHIEMGKVSVAHKENVVIDHLRANYHYANTTGHQLYIQKIATPWSEANGEVKLGLQTPYSIIGKLDAMGSLDGVLVNNAIRLIGSLQDFGVSLDLTGEGVRLKAEAILHPFAKQLNNKINFIQIKGEGINPKPFFKSLPAANLDFDAIIVPTNLEGLSLEGAIDLVNHEAMPADIDGLPIRALFADFTINEDGVLKLNDASVDLLKKGKVAFSGQVDTVKQRVDLAMLLKNITSADALKQNLKGYLSGGMTLKGYYDDLHTAWNFNLGTATSKGLIQLVTDKSVGQQTLYLKQAQIAPIKGGALNAQGQIELFQNQRLQLAIKSDNFNPNKLNTQFPIGKVNGEASLVGELANNTYRALMKFAPSELSGQKLQGNADVVYENQHLSQALIDVLLGRNMIKANGSFGQEGDKLNLNINAPELNQFGFGLSGALNAKGYVAGAIQKIDANLTGQARNVRLNQLIQVNHLDFKLQGSVDYKKPLNIELLGEKIILPSESNSAKIDTVNVAIKGTGYQHNVSARSSIMLSGKPYKLDISTSGGLNDENQWKGMIKVLDVSGAFNLKLQNQTAIEAGAKKISIGRAQWLAMGGNLNLDNFVWSSKNGLITKGSAHHLSVSELSNFFTLPVEHNLVLSGDWNLAYSQDMHGYLNIRKQSGDVILPVRQQTLGLGQLTLNTRFQKGRIDSTLTGVTAYGDVNGNVVINQKFGNDIMQAPINGNLRIVVPDLELLRKFMPVGQTLRGNLVAQTTISGKVGQPQFNGNINGDNLFYRNREIGLILDQGRLRSRLQGQRWLIDDLRFQRGGTLTLKGEVGLIGTAPDVNVVANFDHYTALDQPNRHWTLSGNTSMQYTEDNGIALVGSLRADKGRFGFMKGSMPTLSDDVVLDEAPKEPASPMLISMNLDLDLNDAIRFRGEGLDVTLGGRLNLSVQPKQEIQAVGTVRVVKGQYKAYGQNLEISKGTISFVGPINNPNLNIRAERHLSAVGAGVEVLGNLNDPRVNLVANEPMSDKDKLSWLILNRASSGSDSDEAALSATAGALLAGKINDKIGLVDNIGFTSHRTRDVKTGQLNAAEQVLTVGKQLSRQLYLGYEYGMESANQSVKLVYQLSRSVQAIIRAGSESSGGELKYVIRFD